MRRRKWATHKCIWPHQASFSSTLVTVGAAFLASPPAHMAVHMQGSEYTTDGRDSHASPGGTSRSDISPHQMTGKLTCPLYACSWVRLLFHVAVNDRDSSRHGFVAQQDACTTNDAAASCISYNCGPQHAQHTLRMLRRLEVQEPMLQWTSTQHGPTLCAGGSERSTRHRSLIDVIHDLEQEHAAEVASSGVSPASDRPVPLDLSGAISDPLPSAHEQQPPGLGSHRLQRSEDGRDTVSCPGAVPISQ